MKTDVKGKTAIITGASRGIGKALSRRAAGMGINLAIAARSKELLYDNAATLAGEYGVRVLPVVTDVTKVDDLENLVYQAKKEFGAIDILINNAGVSSQYPFEMQPMEDFELLMKTNYLAYVRLIRLVINEMIQRKSGAIVNMLSGSILTDPVPRSFVVYSSIKVGLRAFCKGLFWELRDHGIKVTSLLPGVADTDLTDNLSEVTTDRTRLISSEAIEDALEFALTVPANVCPLEIAVINQRTPWTKPVIPYVQTHPEK
jgi:3-oxoacyl-[acyl-carrier protein] reductase